MGMNDTFTSTPDNKFLFVGAVPVDSGQVLFVDPCHVYSDDFKPDSDPTGGHYDECCRVSLAFTKSAVSDDPEYLDTRDGVVAPTMRGDGLFPVYAEVDEHGRVVSIMISFDETIDDIIEAGTE